MEVEGRLQAGTLIAETIRFHDEIEIDARVASVTNVTAESVTFELTNLTGITIQVTNLSKISGDANDLTTLANFLNNPPSPDYVEVRGRQLSGVGSVIVFAEEIKIQSGSNDDSIKLQGPVESISDPNVTILGINIDTTNITELEGLNDNSISRATFFGTVMPGMIVGAEGVLSGPIIDWGKIEIEDDE